MVCNTTVARLYAGRVETALDALGRRPLRVELPDGEAFKNWQTLQTIFDALLRARHERSTTLLALGGGVVGDMTGFAAAIYQRGVDFVQLPTTLLAQVDSSVGGKTGINHPLGKNMIGAFHQPRLVLADTDTLSSLPPRELAAGMAEIIKIALVRDAALFAWLEQNAAALLEREPQALGYAIEQACRNKAEVVAADERESGERALLNLGHTFGHAIESGTNYSTWLHGEAVAAGTWLATDLSRRLGWLESTDLERVEGLLRRFRLPLRAPEFGLERYRELMQVDKKVRDGKIRFILLRSLGSAVMHSEVPPDLLRQTLDAGAHLAP